MNKRSKILINHVVPYSNNLVSAKKRLNFYGLIFLFKRNFDSVEYGIFKTFISNTFFNMKIIYYDHKLINSSWS